VPFEERERFARCQFSPVDVRPEDLSFDAEVLRVNLRED
jgi:hypothetical protein